MAVEQAGVKQASLEQASLEQASLEQASLEQAGGAGRTPRRANLENLLTAGLLSLCGLLAAWNLYPTALPAPVTLERSQPNVTVSIAGAITNPGLYELPWGSRVSDLISLAGGLHVEAEETLLNLAMPLDTGSSIYVPNRLTPLGDERISLNSASQRDLESLPGIGPVLAQRIIEARPFYGIDELIKVSGVGPVTMERLRPMVKP